jgi:hypothetical protein
MAKSKPKLLSASRQIIFHQLLVQARKTWLSDALSDALGKVEPSTIKEQISLYVPDDAQKILASAGIRDEHVFPCSALLEMRPTLVGYYRLLLGLPQKTFYNPETKMSQFKSMETQGSINEKQMKNLNFFCKVMSEELAELVRQISPRILPRDISELPILTLGSQFQGGNNNTIGKKAAADVFLSILEIFKSHVSKRSEKEIVIKNSSGRKVSIILGNDPDVSIYEEFSGKNRKKVAIEIKGGIDKSNAHNRAGEAEKSHQKAKKLGFRDFWTIITKKGLDMNKLKDESPTTNSWFDASQILGREGEDWDEFNSRISGEVGVPLKR